MKNSKRDTNLEHKAQKQLPDTDMEPIVFADSVPVYGSIGEVITVTLAAERSQGRKIVLVSSVHLRLIKNAAGLLAKSLQLALMPDIKTKQGDIHNQLFEI